MGRLLLAAAAAAFVSTSASATELITNGGFEDPVISHPCCNTVPPDSLPGWSVTPNINVVNGTFGASPPGTNLAYEGNQYLDLVGQGGAGSISQSFNTVAGEVYRLSFAFSHNLFSGIPTASANFSVDGLAGVLVHTGGSNADLGWQTYTGGFTADDASATLNFTNLTGGINEGIFLDAVSVQAVPEPSTWALLILGFAAIGGAMRSARRKEALAVSSS